MSFLKIGQILTNLQELEDQDAVNHEISEFFSVWLLECIHWVLAQFSIQFE